MSGKGDSPRKVDSSKYGSNYDWIFKSDQWTEAEFLYWLSERLIDVYKEPENSDIVLRLKGIATILGKTNIEEIKCELVQK